jgi:hypothetical protein
VCQLSVSMSAAPVEETPLALLSLATPKWCCSLRIIIVLARQRQRQIQGRLELESPPDKSKERRLLQQLWTSHGLAITIAIAVAMAIHTQIRSQYCPPHRQRQCCRDSRGNYRPLDFQLRRRQTNASAPASALTKR